MELSGVNEFKRSTELSGVNEVYYVIELLC